MKRYSHLRKLKRTDYKSWAYGLKKAGYATAPHYAQSLIKVIETYKLYKYDQ
jgi:flagellum-specific peptidoglycan hydrolase FlgJ